MGQQQRPVGRSREKPQLFGFKQQRSNRVLMEFASGRVLIRVGLRLGRFFGCFVIFGLASVDRNLSRTKTDRQPLASRISGKRRQGLLTQFDRLFKFTFGI